MRTCECCFTDAVHKTNLTILLHTIAICNIHNCDISIILLYCAQPYSPTNNTALSIHLIPLKLFLGKLWPLHRNPLFKFHLYDWLSWLHCLFANDNIRSVYSATVVIIWYLCINCHTNDLSVKRLSLSCCNCENISLLKQWPKNETLKWVNQDTAADTSWHYIQTESQMTK